MTRLAVLYAVCLWGMAGPLALAEPSPTPATQPAAVTVSRQTVTLDHYTAKPRWRTGYDGNGSFYPAKGSQKRAGTRKLKEIVLENAYLRVWVVPELGGVIHRTVYKPTGEDIFYDEGKLKDWLAFWESAVKVGFPYHEHGLGLHQPASWRVVKREDGSVTLAMWMEFSRHNQARHRHHLGRYSNMLLSQHVTLRPGRSTFEVTYRVVNPTGYRQGARLWNDALFPRNHTPAGVVQGDDAPAKSTDTELIYPVAWVSHHNGNRLRELTDREKLVRTHPDRHISLFAWDQAGPFAGLWYPSVKVNRLRIADPDQAPGAKFYWQGERKYRKSGPLGSGHMYNFIELWGGTDHVFEGVERWVGPGEAFEVTHRFTMVRGIGKVRYANKNLAIALDEKKGLVEIVPFADVDSLTVRLDEDAPADLGQASPTKPARWQLPAGAEAPHRLTVRAGTRELARVVLPLTPTRDADLHEQIKDAIHGGAPANEKTGSQLAYGKSIYRAFYDGGTVGKGRVQLRLGHVEAAIGTLTEAVKSDAADGEGWHLLGLAHLQADQPDKAWPCFARAVQAKDAYPQAGYFLALRELGQGQPAEAVKLLARLLRERPGHVEGRLLMAWALLRAGKPTDAAALADALAQDDPADPRIVWLQVQIGTHGGQASAETTEALQALLAEPGARTRLEQFQSACRGQYVEPARLRVPQHKSRKRR